MRIQSPPLAILREAEIPLLVHGALDLEPEPGEAHARDLKGKPFSRTGSMKAMDQKNGR